MKAMILEKIQTLTPTSRPLRLVELPDPQPGPDEVRLRVRACGVCHTELDEIEGRTPPPTLPMVLGHEVIGVVDRVGSQVTRLQVGQRVGVGWIHHSDGTPQENLSPAFRATGRDAPGGYAEWMTVPEEYAFAIPSHLSDVHAAPLMCAGAIGYRALRLTGIDDGQRLGLTGFGGSAHLVLQFVKQRMPNTEIYVFARDAQSRQFALDLGASWAGPTESRTPVSLDAIIDTTPAWTPIVWALRNLAPGGRLVINAIRKEAHDKEALLKLNYHDDLWMEREIKSVANITRYDIADYLTALEHVDIRPHVQTYHLEQANDALVDLKFKPVRGAKVLVIDPSPTSPG
ncbi:MAG: alcohol dehydrogenase [Pirellulaceae bacterium]|nr:MAG: alcohol dehydrogenase [Pirellulaceae bacterium]